MSTEATAKEGSDDSPTLKEKIISNVTKYHTLARTDLAKKLIQPRLPSFLRPHLQTITNQLNSFLESHLPSPITEEDVILVGLLLHMVPSLFLMIRHTNIPSLSAEIFCTLVYPVIKTVKALEQRRHDQSGHLLSFWVFLCATHILDNLFGLRWYFPRSFLPLKCLVSYCMLNSKRQWILVWDVVVMYPHVLPQLGLGDGRKHRADLMKKEAEEKDDAALDKKIETTATSKKDKVRDGSPASNASEFSYVDLAELESKQKVDLKSVMFKVKDITAEKLMTCSPEKDAESPYLVFDIVDSKDVGHTEAGKGKKYKTLEGALVEEEEDEEEEVKKEPELVAEDEEEETKDTTGTEDAVAAGEDDKEEKEEDTEKSGNDEKEATDEKKATTDTTVSEDKPLEEGKTATEQEKKSKSTSFIWDGQIVSIPAEIRSSTTATDVKEDEDAKNDKDTSEPKTATTTTSPEDDTSSFLRIVAYEKCTIGNDSFVGMSHLQIADLIGSKEEKKGYKILLKNDKAPEDFNAGEVSMSVICE